MRSVLILILAGVTSFEVYQTVLTVKKWNYHKITVSEEKYCPDQTVIIQRVEHNPINSLNIDSFLQVYGITAENIHGRSTPKKIKKQNELLIEPKKISPELHKFKIKITR